MKNYKYLSMEVLKNRLIIKNAAIVGGLHSERWDRSGNAANKTLDFYGIDKEYPLNNLTLDEKDAQKKRILQFCEEITINQQCILRYAKPNDTELFESLVDNTTFKTEWGRKAQIDVRTEVLLKSAATRTKMIAERIMAEGTAPNALSELSVRTFYNLGGAAFVFVPSRDRLVDMPLGACVRDMLKRNPIVEYDGFILVRGGHYSEKLRNLLNDGGNIIAVV